MVLQTPHLQRMFLTLALAWMALIFFLSHQPSLPAPSLFPGQDKLFHGIFFGVLGGFFMGAMRGPATILTWKHVLIATLGVLAYGISDEVHQHFVPGRTTEMMDVVADTIGGLVVTSLIRVSGGKTQ